MTASKLPEWPEKARTEGHHPADEWHIYWMDTAEAALARMEALVDYAMHTGPWCSQNSGHACTCGLSELLAACARKEAAR